VESEGKTGLTDPPSTATTAPSWAGPAAPPERRPTGPPGAVDVAAGDHIPGPAELRGQCRVDCSQARRSCSTVADGVAASAALVDW